MKDILDSALLTVIYLASGFILFLIGKWVYQLIHRRIKVKDELVEQDNLSFAIAHTGYFIGLLLAIGSVIMGPSLGIVNDLIDIVLYGLLSIVLLNLSIIINDKVLLRKFNIYDEIIRDQNAGAGAIEAANAIATGLIILGAVYGEGGGWITALVYWAIGQVLLLLTTLVYDLITPYSVHHHIEQDNVAVGIGFGGAMIAIGNLIRHGLMAEFVNWQESLMWVGIDVAVGLVFLPIARWIADVILLPGQKLTDEVINQEKPNVGAAIIEAFAYIGGSVLISWCW